MSTPNPLHADYLFLQPLIIKRLADQVPELPVDGAERMSQSFENDMRPMAVWVVWGGDRFAADAPQGASFCRQGWLILLAMRNVAQTPDARNSAAGPWLAKLHQALNGWSPTGQPGAAKFARVQGPKPDYKSVSALYPLMFEIPLHF